MPDKEKGTVFRENRMGDHKLAYDEQITNLIFWFSFLKTALCVYGEYGEQRKVWKIDLSPLILDQNKNFSNPCFIPLISLNDQKTISRYCHFKVIGKLEENLINGKRITALEGKKEKRGRNNMYVL
jgi:hypothetical protein